MGWFAGMGSDFYALTAGLLGQPEQADPDLGAQQLPGPLPSTPAIQHGT